MLGLRRPKTTPGRSDAGSDDETCLRSPWHITRLLRNVVNSHALLSIQVAGRSDVFCSALLAVNRAGGQILVDEPNETRDGPIAAGDTLAVSAWVDGVRLRFHTVVQEFGSNRRGGYYRLAFPDSVDYEQRRAHHRAPATSAAGVTVLLGGEADGPVEASLRDLSIGGMSVRVAGGGEWRAGRSRIPCSLTLHEQGAVIECAFEVRRKGRQGKLTLLAGRFLDLDRRARNAIERCVTELEREQLRKRP